jgi:methionyl-tRNA synthetase
MLMSAGLPVPDRVYGHGFLTKDGQKMGKSQGNTLDPVGLVKQYGSDAVRYYFLREIEFGKDGDFNETRFVNVLNADLANDLGNLLNRTLKMATRYCGDRVPEINVQTFGDDHPLRAIGVLLEQTVSTAYRHLAFSQACTAVLALVQASNKFVDDQAPWSLFKQGKQAETEAVLYAVLESVRQAAYLLSPIIPGVSNQIYAQLGLTADFNDKAIGQGLNYPDHAAWGYLPPGQPLGVAAPVFQRLELPELVPSA